MCSSRSDRSDRGLTLVELMIGMVVAAILMTSVYYVYSVSTGAYRTQAQTMRAMDQARFGLEQIRRDLAATGFLTTPASNPDTSVCPKPVAPNPPIRGFVLRREGATNNNPMTPHGVVLFGSFWGSGVFYTQSVLGTIVTLQAGTPGFPRNQAEWEQFFVAGRFLRIVNSDQYEGYYPITGSNFGNRTITLQTPVPQVAPPETCGVTGMGVGLEVSIAGYVHYVLRADPREQGKVDLVREEIVGTSAGLNVALPNSAIAVAEYVADLQFYDFAFDAGTATAPRIEVVPFETGVLDGGTRLLNLSDQARPQDLRAVTVKLTTRTEAEDERWTFLGDVYTRTLHSPIDYYEVDPTMRGAARTVSLATRVGLRAFAVRNVK